MVFSPRGLQACLRTHSPLRAARFSGRSTTLTASKACCFCLLGPVFLSCKLAVQLVTTWHFLELQCWVAPGSRCSASSPMPSRRTVQSQRLQQAKTSARSARLRPRSHGKVRNLRQQTCTSALRSLLQVLSVLVKSCSSELRDTPLPFCHVCQSTSQKTPKQPEDGTQAPQEFGHAHRSGLALVGLSKPPSVHVFVPFAQKCLQAIGE